MARRLAALLLGLFVLAAGAALADESSDRSWLVGWVENTISTPDRQIRLGRIDGALSSDVRLESITIADRRGVWLAIRDVHLVWSRADLLKGRLTVATLDAGAIEVTRKPDPAEAEATAAADDAASDFALPDLPVAVEIGRISVPTVRLPAEIAGRPTVLSIAGRGRLDGGDLDVDLAATRIEPQGGSFSLKTTYVGSTRRLALDLALHEPKGGFLSTLLALPGEPAIGFAIRGDAPVDAFTAAIGLDADGRALLAGRAETRLDGTDRTFAIDVGGSLEALVGTGSLTGGGSELHVFARRSADGAVRLDRARLSTGVASFDAAGDYVPSDGGTTVALDRFAVAWKEATLELARPASVRIADGTVTIPASTFRLGLADTKTFGTIDVAGTAGRDLAVDVTARRLPVAIARVAVPDLGAEGTLALDARVGGPRKAPTVVWKVIADRLSTAATRDARLPTASATATGTFAARATTLDAAVAIGPDAKLSAKGRLPLAGPGLALDLAAERLPLAFADGVVPGLGGRGTLSATAVATGSLAAPTVDWTVAGSGLGVAATRDAGLPPANLTARGRLDRSGTTLLATLAERDRLKLVADGRVPFDDGDLAVKVSGTAALALADAASPGLGGRGTLTLTAAASGTLAAPIVDWKVAGSGLGVAAGRSAGVPPATLAAGGRLDRTATTLAATLVAGDRAKLAADGRVPFDGGDLAVKVSGTASLALADAALRDRGAHATGRLALDVAIAGPLAAPKPTGTITLADGGVTDPETAMRLSALTARIRLTGDRMTIEELRARTGEAGTLALKGGLGLGPDLSADLTLSMREARLSLGDTLRTVVGGDLRLSGPLLREPTVAGRLDLGRTEITIPERFAANAARLGVKDLAAPPEVARTLALARPKAARGGGKTATTWRARLDVTVDAPSRLFVRGRGLDAELGGRLRVTGTTDAPIPVGAFELRRGALDVIGRHIALDKGTVTLSGDLDPAIDFQASSSTRSVAVVAAVTGRASDPTLMLSSTPELPQDEVLAQFLFGRGVADLTGFQLVQLATAAAQLAGGPSAPDLLGKIRRSTGLDNLGTTTDSKGNAGLTAGRYIGEKIYLGVTAGAAGSTDATVDLDVTRNLKLRGQTGTDGSKAGFVFEKEY